MSWQRCLLLGAGAGAILGLAAGWLTLWALLLAPVVLVAVTLAVRDAEDQA